MQVEKRLEQDVQQIAIQAYRLFTQQPVAYILAFLLTAVVSGVTCGVMSGPLTIGFLRMVRQHQQGQSIGATGVFDWGGHLVPSLLATILLGIAVAVGSVLLVLPGLAVAFFSIFALHGMAYSGLDITQSFKNSLALVSNNLLFVFVIAVGLAVLNALGSAVLFGTLLTGPWGIIALSLTYQHLIVPEQMSADNKHPPAAF